MKKLALHTQILLGMALGLLFAIASVSLGCPPSWTTDYIKPFGTVFLNSLKMVAIPLIFASLIVGITSIEDTTKLSRIGRKTFFIYTLTTAISVVIGLGIANAIGPGRVINHHTRERLMSLYDNQVVEHDNIIQNIHQNTSPLQVLIDLVPENLFSSMSDNGNLLQVVFVAILVGIALLKIPPRKSKVIMQFFEGANDALIEVIGFIMKTAPIGVFALVASLMVEVAGDSNPKEILEIIRALLLYVATTVLGLASMTFVVYPIALKLFTKMSFERFIRGIYPAQLVAFTTSSSSAALPVTMERAERHLGISEEISSFVLPLGATVNMDGTALYQGVAIVFIAQALGIDLSLSMQLIVVTNVVISSIGVAGVPGGAIVTTAMLLQSIGIPPAGLALILAPDRILDMCRTATNITGDAMVATIVASSEGEVIEQVNEKLLENETY